MSGGGRARSDQYGGDQNSTVRLLPCVTMISCGETGADASVVPPFGLASVVTDQTTAIAATAATVATTKRLRMCHLRVRMSYATALPYRPPNLREAPHRG